MLCVFCKNNEMINACIVALNGTSYNAWLAVKKAKQASLLLLIIIKA